MPRLSIRATGGLSGQPLSLLGVWQPWKLEKLRPRQAEGYLSLGKYFRGLEIFPTPVIVQSCQSSKGRYKDMASDGFTYRPLRVVPIGMLALPANNERRPLFNGSTHTDYRVYTL